MRERATFGGIQIEVEIYTIRGWWMEMRWEWARVRKRVTSCRIARLNNCDPPVTSRYKCRTVGGETSTQCTCARARCWVKISFFPRFHKIYQTTWEQPIYVASHGCSQIDCSRKERGKLCDIAIADKLEGGNRSIELDIFLGSTL